MIFFQPLARLEEWEWVQRRARPIQCSDTQGIVAYNERNQIQAVCVFDSWTDDACNVHFAIDNPFVIKHGFFEQIATHVYHTCGRARMFGMVPADNERALKLDKHIGFSEVARIPHGYATGVDYIILGLEKADCRWLPEEYQEAA